MSQKIKQNLCSLETIKEVRYLYFEENLSKKQISLRTKLSLSRIGKIIQQQNIEFLQSEEQSLTNYRFNKIHGRAKQAIQNFIDCQTTPIQCKDIQDFVLKETGLKLSKTLLQKYLKTQLHMSYRKLRPITFRHNATNSKLCRQYAAKYFIHFLFQGKILINIDESIISQTDNRSKGWFKKFQQNFESHSQRLSQVSIIAGVSSDGKFYYTINQGKNNSLTFSYFLLKLIQQLDSEDIKWRASTILVVDNAAYHRSSYISQFFSQFQIPHMFLGPYHYRMAPVENMFAFIKNRDINALKSRAETKLQLIPLIKEMIVQISQLDTQWVQKSFAHSLIAALNCLSLKDL